MKRIQITDLHFGNKNNDIQHNEDLLKFFRYLVSWCKERGIDPKTVGIDILGDTFQQRDKLSVITINYALEGIRFLADNFIDVRILIGNHDLPYRDSRRSSSMEIFRDIPGVKIVDYYEIDGSCMYVSWLVNEDELEEVVKVSKKNKIRWIFGHFEFSNFRLNDNFITEHGASHKVFKHVEKVYTGHYHAHQVKDNVEYIGTPFPYDMNDANDFDRGFQIFDTETGEMERVIYEDVAVLSMSVSELLENDWSGMDNVTVRVVIDDHLDDKSYDMLKEKLEAGGFRSTSIVHKINKGNEILNSESDADFNGEIKSIDKLVIEHINNMTEVDGIDKGLLASIYMNAKEKDSE